MRRKPEKLVNFINAKAFCFAVVLIAIVSNTSFGQSITWQRIYNGPANQNDRVFSLSPADGNNFYAVGSTVISGNYHYILKLNEFGDTIWTRIFQFAPPIGDFSLSSTEDGNGGVVVTGDSDSSFTLRLDKNGNIVWYKSYGMIAATGNTIIRKNRNGYLVCGRKLGSDYYGYVLNIDSLGEIIWQKLYLSTEFKNYESAVELNNGYFLAGDVLDAVIDTQHVLLTKIDYSGDIEWEKRHTVFGRGGNAKKMLKLDGRLLIAGTTYDSLSGGKGYFLITDTIGNMISTKVFQYPKYERLTDVIALNNNKLIFTLTRDSTIFLKITRVLIADTVGNILQEKLFVPPQREGYIFFESIMKANNGDFIYGGYSELDTNNSNADVHLARTDSLLYAPPIGIPNSSYEVPMAFEILPPYPNPFNPSTSIEYRISKTGIVKISLYDINGKLISIILNENKQTGVHLLKIELSKYNLSTGVYFLKFTYNNSINVSSKIILIK